MNNNPKSFQLNNNGVVMDFEYDGSDYSVSIKEVPGAVINISGFTLLAAETMEGLTGKNIQRETLMEKILAKLKET